MKKSFAKLTVTQLVKKIQNFYRTQTLISALTKSCALKQSGHRHEDKD